MTVATIDSVIARVMFVAELDGLLNFNPLAGVPGRATNLSGDPQGSQENEERSKDGGLRQRVRAVMKNLWHRRSLANTQFELQIESRIGVQRESLELQTARHDQGTQRCVVITKHTERALSPQTPLNLNWSISECPLL